MLNRSEPQHDVGAVTVAKLAGDRHALQTRLEAAMEEVLDAIAAGVTLDREALLVKYNDVAEELADCLNNLDFIQNVAPQLADDAIAQSADELSAISGRANLGDFRVIREIGRGGMGVVYEAKQMSLGRRMALKVFPFAAMLDKQQLKRFKNEARAAATLDHPNIVAVHSVGEERGVHYYAMQLIEGQSLAEVIAQLRATHCPDLTQPEAAHQSSRIRQNSGQTADARILANSATKMRASSACQASLSEQSLSQSPLPRFGGEGRVRGSSDVGIGSNEHADTDTKRDLQAAISTIPPFDSHEYYRTVARLGMQAAQALDHAHQNGILHRDVKPGNLLVDSDGKLWVTDFGLARMESDAGMTMTGDLLGTLAYMSPEQALAQRVVVDHRTDIYSLGASLYELLALRRAYTGNDRQELLKQIAFDEAPGLRKLNPNIPSEMETIVGKAIEKNPADRYATAHELANDLRRFLENLPILAKPPSVLDKIAKWSRRHVGLVWTALAASLAVLAVLTVSTFLIAQSQRETTRQRDQAKTEKDEAQHQRDLAVQERNAARRSRYDAEIVSAQTDQQNRNLGGLNAKLMGHLPLQDEPDIRGWEWYYLTSLCHPELRTLRNPKNWEYFRGNDSFASFSSDGKLIGMPGSIWDANTGACVRGFIPSLIIRKRVAWSPNGKKFAWAIADDDNAVYLWDRKSDAVTRLSGHESSVWCLAWSPNGERLASGSMDNTIRIWDVATGRVVQTFPTAHYVNSVSWSSDGTLLAAGISLHGLSVWDVSKAELVLDLPEASKGRAAGGDIAVSWHPKGRILAVSTHVSTNPRWYLLSRDDWTVKTEHKLTAAGHGIAWSPLGTQIAVTDGQSVAIWDSEGKQQQATLHGHLRIVRSVDWRPDGSGLVTSDSGGEVKLWDLASPPQTPDIATGSPIESIAWLPDSKTLVAIGAEDKSQAYYSAKDGSLEKREPPNVALPFRLSPDRRLAAVQSSEESVVTIFDARSGQTHSVLSVRPESRIHSIDFSHDASTVAIETITDNKPLLEFWQVDREQRLSTWSNGRRKPHDAIQRIAWNRDSSRVAVVCWGDIGDEGGQYWQPHVHVLDVANGSRLLKHTLRSEGTVSALAWSADERHVAVGTSQGWLERIDLNANPVPSARKICDARISSVAWFHDGTLLACAADDGIVTIVSARSNVNLLNLPLPDEGAATLAWSPDGKRLAAATARGTIRQWDATRGYEFGEGTTPPGELAWAYHDRAAATSGRERELALRAVLKHAPDALEFWELRGSVLAQLGDFSKAAQEFAKAIGPDIRYSFSAALDRALCQFAAGETGLYHEACAALVTEFSESPIPSNRSYVAWLCALAPHELIDSKIVLGMAEYSKDYKSNQTDETFITFGASLYRAGQFDRAAKVLSKPVTSLNQGGDPKDCYLLTCSQYFLAMARQQLGQGFQARRVFGDAVRNSEQLHLYAPSWRQQVVVAALHRETARLLMMTEERTQTKPE